MDHLTNTRRLSQLLFAILALLAMGTFTIAGVAAAQTATDTDDPDSGIINDDNGTEDDDDVTDDDEDATEDEDEQDDTDETADDAVNGGGMGDMSQMLTTPLVVAQSAPAPMVLDISSDGTALVRGVVTAVDQNSITISTWGGPWVIRTETSQVVAGAPDGTAGISAISPGDFVGAEGQIATDAPLTVDAAFVRNWTTNPYTGDTAADGVGGSAEGTDGTGGDSTGGTGTPDTAPGSGTGGTSTAPGTTDGAGVEDTTPPTETPQSDTGGSNNPLY